MKIAHIGLGAFFTEGMTYQDNYLSHQNALDGHQVLYVSNAEKYENGITVPTGYQDIVLPDGVRLVRLPYVRVINRFISSKVRKVRGLYRLLEDFAPDVILAHDLTYWSVLDVIRYKKDHPQVTLYADFHAMNDNSGTNWLSLHVLHRIFYRYLVQKALPYVKKYLYVASECKDFSMENYHVPESLMELYPLGGTLPDDDTYVEVRARRRTELGVSESDRLYLHSGKLDALKRTDELLKAFSSVDDPHAVMAIIGKIPEDRKNALQPLIEADPRIRYLGWKSGDELQEYLCAADLYCQPGTQSSTMENAVCNRCPVMVYPYPYYAQDINYGNLILVKTQDDMEQAFAQLKADPARLKVMSAASLRCAEELLDYRKLAARLYR